MKRIINALLFVISLSVLLSTTTFAAEKNKYHLDELGMSISIPEGLAVFTRDTKANDPNLKLFGHTKESMLSIMESGSIYLNALDKNGEYEIVVTMTQSPFEDFSLLSDTSLTALSSTFANTYEKAGATFIDSEVYVRNGAKYLRTNSSQIKNGSTIYSSHFTTAHMGKLINITVHSYSGEGIDRLYALMLQGIVNSIAFDVAPAKADTPSSPSPAFTYTDINSGTTFTVPENWVESPMFEEREYLDAKFTSNLEEGLGILYTCEDIFGSEEWQSELTPAEKMSISRADVDNSILTKEAVAEMLPGEFQNVSMVSYGGAEYFFTEGTASGSVYGLNISMPSTYAVRCENGYMYMFQFSGGKDSPYFKDFESLLSSVTYPPVAPEGSLLRQFTVGGLIVSLLITITVYSLPIALYRYAIKKEPVGKKKAATITVVYALGAFIVMSIIVFAINGEGSVGGAILLWSWVNFRMLTGRQPRQRPPAESSNAQDGVSEEPALQREAEADNQAPPPFEADPCEDISQHPEHAEDQIMFCHKCGNKLMPESLFCNKCGTKISKG